MISSLIGKIDVSSTFNWTRGAATRAEWQDICSRSPSVSQHSVYQCNDNFDWVHFALKGLLFKIRVSRECLGVSIPSTIINGSFRRTCCNSKNSLVVILDLCLTCNFFPKHEKFWHLACEILFYSHREPPASSRLCLGAWCDWRNLHFWESKPQEQAYPALCYNVHWYNLSTDYGVPSVL